MQSKVVRPIYSVATNGSQLWFWKRHFAALTQPIVKLDALLLANDDQNRNIFEKCGRCLVCGMPLTTYQI